MKLQKYFSGIVFVLLCLYMLSSCMKDDEEVTVDDHCYISAFTLGSLKRTIHTQTASGEDSTYTVVLDASAFPMSIDQRNLVIENRDSLPYGTRVNAVLVTIGYTGVIGYKQAGAVELTTYSSKDSIDFSSPVEFVVYSQNGTSERHYKVKLNVHRQDGTKFDWCVADTSDVLNQLYERKMVAVNQRLVMVGKTSAGAVLMASRSTTLQDSWVVTPTSGTEQADVMTLQVAQDGSFLMSTTIGALLKSTDGVNWQIVTDACENRVLAGVSSDRIYAVFPDALQSSADGGQTWKDETLDVVQAKLPDSYLNLVSCMQADGQHRLVLMGMPLVSSNKNVAEVWSKAWSQSDQEKDAVWMYYPHTADNSFLCPIFLPMFVFSYDKGLVAFGGKTLDGKTDALSTMLYSPDFGLTWKKNDELTLPKELRGNENPLAAVVDGENFIWITAGTVTWRGRLNRLGFKQGNED